MGIRGDMEARYWAELGHDKPREIAEWVLDCLKDPGFWTRLEGEGYTADEVSAFLSIIDDAKAKFLTHRAPINV